MGNRNLISKKITMKLVVALCLIAATYAMNECGSRAPHHDLRNDVGQKALGVAAQTSCLVAWSGVYSYNQTSDYSACTTEETAENLKEALECAADADCVADGIEEAA